MDLHLEFVIIALIQGSLHVHIQWKRGLKEKCSGTCQSPEPRARMRDVLHGWCTPRAWLQKVLLKVFPPRTHCEFQSPKDSKFWLVLHRRPCEINWTISKNYWWCNKYTSSLFFSGVHLSLTLVDVTRKSARSAYAAVRALGVFSDYPKNYIL